ncbi:hypothetical protein ACFFGH_26360 [Lysobacter korlensis]|uniref:Uncharacterized protein n=1 Tax=Lysobacter korlensis TaxID=553636 RepID=A0ABV6RZP8_9GAMM
MRWENLFQDLEGQLEQELDAEELELRAEEERLRIGRMTLRDRIVAASGDGTSVEPLRLVLSDGARLELRLTAYGRDWVAGEAVGELRRHGPVVVPLGSIATVLLDSDQLGHSLTAAPAGASPPLADRLGLAFVLRTVCRRRSAVDLVLTDGRVHGTVDRVGRDHLDLAVHEPGLPRRRDAVRQVRLVPFAQLVLVRI